MKHTAEATDDSKSAWAGRRGLLLLLMAAFAFRVAILAAGQKYLRSDEAVVGLMAKHIITLGEHPLFLYGQSYGGGHAITAYIAAPLFAIFGLSGAILTAIPAMLSLVSVWLVWLIVKRHMGEKAALAAAALYAFSPPVVYQAFLVNGGTETFLLALVALFFFLRIYPAGKSSIVEALPVGFFAGFAYYAMDYALLYAIVFVLLLAAARRWKEIAGLALGFLVGCAPLVYLNLTTNFSNIKEMLGGGPPQPPNVIGHFASAMWGLAGGNLASFFAGDIDDLLPGGPGAWVHAAVAVIAVAWVAWRERKGLQYMFPDHRGAQGDPIPLRKLLPVLFIIVYLGMFGVAKFSLPEKMTPRYLLPLCPFVSICIALAVSSFGQRGLKQAGWVIISLLVLHGAVISWQVNARDWHYEHRIKTSGRQIEELAKSVRQAGIRYAFAPYEIQWRLMFAADESVVVSCENISEAVRYPAYEMTVGKAVFQQGQPYAYIFRNDFAFTDWACGLGAGAIKKDWFTEACRSAGISETGNPAGSEFVYYYPLDLRFMDILRQVSNTRQAAEQNRP